MLNFISRMHAKTYRADFTGGKTKLNSEGTERNGVPLWDQDEAKEEEKPLWKPSNIGSDKL